MDDSHIIEEIYEGLSKIGGVVQDEENKECFGNTPSYGNNVVSFWNKYALWIVLFVIFVVLVIFIFIYGLLMREDRKKISMGPNVSNSALLPLSTLGNDDSMQYLVIKQK